MEQINPLVIEATEITRSRIMDATHNEFDGRAVLLFSGGRDSTAVTGAFSRAFPQGQLHLLLVDNGLLSRLDNTQRQANLLKALYPSTDIRFHTKRVSEMMRRVGMQSIEKDFTTRKYSTLLICITCKIIMSVAASRYAREVGTKIVMDGYASRQNNYPEQTIAFMDIIRQFYKDAGITYISPLYDLLDTKPKTQELVQALGCVIPKQEPICMFADSFDIADKEEIKRYTQIKLEEVLKLDPVLCL